MSIHYVCEDGKLMRVAAQRRGLESTSSLSYEGQVR